MRRPRNTRWSAPALGAVTAIALVLGACSGGDDDDAVATTAPVATDAATTAAPATTEPAATTAPPTTAPETVVSEPVTTEPPATTATEATEPPATTVAPATTTPQSETTIPVAIIDASAPEAVEMIAAMQSTMTAYIELFRTPDDEAKVAEVLSRTTGAMDRIVERSMELLAERGQQSRAGAVETRFEVFESTVLVVPGNNGGLDVCYVDGDLVVEPGAGDDGSDLVVEDDVTSYRVGVSMDVVDNEWKVSNLQFFDTFEEQEGCS